MALFSLFVNAAENQDITSQTIFGIVPLLPFIILMFFFIIGILAFYFLYILPRKKEKPVSAPQIPNVPPPPSYLTSAQPSTTSTNVPSNNQNLPPKPAPAFSTSPSLVTPPKTQSVPFYKKSSFLIIIFLFLLLAIPTVVYFGVKSQQSIRGRATEGDCCSGTPQCASDEQCVTDTSSKCNETGQGVCKKKGTDPQGCCSSNADCAPWETCDPGNPACSSGKSCRSHAGCSRDSDCPAGDKCVGGTCQGAGVLECYADKDGVRIVNNTASQVSGSVSWFSNWCNSPSCGCVGSSTNETITLGVGESWSRNIRGQGPPTNCSWQSDVIFASCHNTDHGCEAGCDAATPTPTVPGQPTPTPTLPQLTPTPTPTTPVGTPTPTPTPPAAGQCWYIKILDSNGERIIDLTKIKTGEVIRLVVAGSDSSFDSARFRVNGGTWVANDGVTNNEFYKDYTVPAGILNFQIDAMVHHPTLGWK